MNDDNQTATKADLKEFGDSIVKDIGESISELTDMVAKRFNEVDQRIDEVDDKLGAKLDRLELKVNTVTDDHAMRISKLEQTAGIQ